MTNQMNTNELTTNALALAAAGHKVYPVCAERHPYQAEGYHAGTTDEAAVRRAFSCERAVYTGIKVDNDILCIDLDTDRQTGENVGECSATNRMRIQRQSR